ncbi:MAG: WD40 repeat domain-containing serine/threonine protein kinase, partial [Thermoanaerobaculia bacterium]
MSDAVEAQRWRRVAELFDSLTGLPAAERSAHLDELGIEDPALRSEVEDLLSEADAVGLLDAPPAEVLATLLDELEEAIPEQPVGARIGPYRLVEELGRGGMGVVYLAERVDGQFEQRVALKLVKRGLDTEEVLARFRRERQILARLDHRAIARLFDGGATEDGRPYFAMEHVVGEPITVYCDGRRLSIEERLKLFRRVCEAVHHAHRHLVVHRDLKPSNVLVTAEGDLKLLDFGVAKLLGSGEEGQAPPTLTRVGLRAMTPEYAAPEQVLGNPVSTATDVYALGVVLYELLTGRRPYRLGRRFGAEAERTILEVEPERPSAVVEAQPEDPDRTAEELARARGLSPGGLRRRLTGDLDAIVLTALRKEPERRYGSAQGLGEDLERHLAGEPVTARPEGWAYRAAKFSRRHRAALAIVGALLGLGVLGFFVERGRRAARREIVTQHLATGMELAAAGDALGALPWLARALELEPDAAAREDHRLRIGTLLEYVPRLVRQWAHAGPVVVARFSPDGTRVVTVSEDGTARVWSVASGEPLAGPLRHDDRLSWAEFSPDSRQILTAGVDADARLWDATTGALVRSLPGHERGIAFASFSPDGRRIVAIGPGGTRLWDALSGASVAVFPQADRSLGNPLFDRRGRRLVTASAEEARVWDAETGAPVGPPLRPPGGIGDNGATLSPDGSWVAVTPIDGRCATVWEAATGGRVAEMCGSAGVGDAFFDAAGRRLFVSVRGGGGYDLWDLTDPIRVVASFDHSDLLQFALPSEDGGHLLTSS